MSVCVMHKCNGYKIRDRWVLILAGGQTSKKYVWEVNPAGLILNQIPG